MLTRPRLFSFVAILLVAAFCFGLGRLLVLRYSRGDVFPPYSSLRADPLGTKVFYESLRTLPGASVSRNERPLHRLGSGEGRTLFLLGVRGNYVSDKARDALEHFVQTGGRVVLALFPRYEAPVSRLSGAPTPTPAPAGDPADDPEPTPAGSTFKQLLTRWELELKEDRDANDDVAVRRVEMPLEENLRWHSGLSFHAHHPDWRVVYDCKRGPVLLERAFGAGSMVLASDSYFVSNEALLTERAPALLAWLAGENRRVVFDESHLNIREEPGVATLLRRYGLTGFVVGFLILLGLWLWRNASFALAPRRPAAAQDEVVSARDSFGGFVHLLRRGIPRSQLLDVCMAEWKKSAAASRGTRNTHEDALRHAIHGETNPVAAYTKVSALLRSNSWKTTPAS